MLSFDITEDTKFDDIVGIKIAKLAYSLGVVEVLIHECNNNIKVLSDNNIHKQYDKNIAENIVLKIKYQSQKEHFEKLVMELL